jgi:hypothetical protein
MSENLSHHKPPSSPPSLFLDNLFSLAILNDQSLTPSQPLLPLARKVGWKLVWTGRGV